MPIGDVGEAYRYWLDLWKSGYSWPRTGVLILSCGLQPAASPQGRMFRGLRGSEEPLFHGPRNPITRMRAHFRAIASQKTFVEQLVEDPRGPHSSKSLVEERPFMAAYAI